MIDRAFWNLLSGHLLKTQSLSAELEIIMFLLSAWPVFVFDRVGRLAVKLNDIGPSDQPQGVRPERQRPLHTDARLNRMLGFVHLSMNGPTSEGVQVFIERLFYMNQSALARTVAVVLQSGDHDEVVI